MSRVVVGSIPDKIAYTYSKESEVFVGSTWDIEYSYDEKKHLVKYEKENVLSTFVSDTSPASIKKAQKWASGWRAQEPSTTVEVDNKPISNIRLLSIEYRGRGGRAYKALIDKYYVDLREDVLMDTMLQAGVAPGGILQGEFIWAKLSGQMKLVRIGSELYKLIMEFESTKDAKPVGKRKLEVGAVYQDRRKNKAIFLGYVNTVLLSLKDKSPYYNRKKATFEYEQKPVKKAMLFYDVRYGSLEENITSMRHQASNFKYDVKRSHQYIEKVGHVDIDPSDIVAFLREKALKETKTKLLQYTGHEPLNGYAKPTDTYLEDTVVYNSERLNLYPFGSEDAKVFDIKKYLVFS